MEDYKKKYKEVLKRIEECVPDDNGFITIYPQELFPELRESEDERIKKALIRYFTLSDEHAYNEACGVSYRDIVAWLKRQGEQKSMTDFSDLRTWKYIVDAVWTEKEGIGQYLDSPFTENVAKKLQKRFGNIEQKPTNKVEPKFKVGDIIEVKPMKCHGKIFTGKPNKIVDITEKSYILDDGKAYSIELQDGWKLSEQNPAWSKEDEEMHRKCICAMRASACGFPEEEKFVEQVDNWLKSLKERYTWKPNDKQIACLSDAVARYNREGFSAPILTSLLEQLKKLREELL